MNDHDVRSLFDTVLTAPPPDLIDVDAAIRTGRRRQRTVAVVLSAAAVLVILGVTTAIIVPRAHRGHVTPAAAGVPVTSAQQILGSWTTIELDGQDMRAARDLGLQPLGVRFYRVADHLGWTANDIVNDNSGPFSVSEHGEFHAQRTYVTLVGPPPAAPYYQRNYEVVTQATAARLVPATRTAPEKLELLAGTKITAVYTPAQPQGTAAGFVGYKWTVKSIAYLGKATALPADNKVYLAFAPDGKVGANEPVNYHFGSYTLVPDGFITNGMTSAAAGSTGKDPVEELSRSAIQALDKTHAQTLVLGDTLTVKVGSYTLTAQRNGRQANF